ncbi:MAG: sulfatase [Actinobacteria bacterium]|nr:sulfatase [Actinomycetota bacterium]
MSGPMDRRELLWRAGLGAAAAGASVAAGCGAGGGEAATTATRPAATAETLTAAQTRAQTSAAIRAARVRKVKRGEAPNLLLVIVDSIRADHLGSYGRRDAHTPNLDALARESLRFTHVYPEAFPTGPARATIYGGRRIFPFADWRAPPPDMPGTPGWQDIPVQNLVTTLRGAGWFTALAVDTPWVLVPSQQPFQQALHRYVPIPGQTGTATHPASLISDAELERHVPPRILHSSSGQKMRQYLANQVGRRSEADYLPAKVFTAGMRLLEECNRQRKPFALMLDCFDPHEPWDPPARYIKLHGGSLDRAWDPGTVLNGTTRTNGLGPDDVAQMKALYRAELSMSDHWFGNFMQRLHDLRLERETLILFLSDHGFLLGERGYVAKMATQCHPELIHVPLMIRSPDGRGAGKTTDYLTQTQDVATTLLRAGTVRRPDFMDGQDLLPLLDGARGKRKLKRREYVTGSYSSIVFARDRRWSYIGDNQNADPQLFDHRRDPHELRDLAASRPAQVRRMYDGMVVRDNGGRALPKFG